MLNFDIIIMQSQEEADEIINKIKQIDKIFLNEQEEKIINFEYDDSNLLNIDKIRVEQAIKKYIR